MHRHGECNACVNVCLQTGERIRVAIKTCKDCSADVKEKFLSEAGEYEAVAVIISFRNNLLVHIQVSQFLQSNCKACQIFVKQEM